MMKEKTLGDKVIRAGAIAAAVTAIVALSVMAFVAGDKYAATPCIQNRALPLIISHEKRDSVKWIDNEKKHEEIRSLVKQEFRVIMVYTKAGMSERAKQQAKDELVNDTTISPELKN
jgi:hypothetical protein